MKIFINPGHDITLDAGAINKNLGLRECDVALKIANQLQIYLETIGYETQLMQDDDLSLVVFTANDYPADIFLSIHCNAFNQEVRGTETLIYQKNTLTELLANCIHQQLVNTLQKIDGDFPNRGIKERPNLYVLKNTNMPAVLIEAAFIDNDTDAKLLIAYIDDIARAIARGVTDFYQ